MSIKNTVIQTALAILGENPEGVGYSELCNLLAEKLPGVNSSNFNLHVYHLPETHGDEVYKPERGKYRLRKFAQEDEQRGSPDMEPVSSGEREQRERRLYPMVADFLRGIDECTSAIPFGGNHFGGKNNTPDVIGIMQQGIGQVLDFPIEVISAEVKYNAADAITGFGQACAYRLFSHKSYLVVPDNESEEMGRVESLCNLFGIGLIVFKETSETSNGDQSENRPPEFTVKTRAIKHSPDMFYFKAYPDNFLRKNPNVASKLLRGESEQESEE